MVHRRARGVQHAELVDDVQDRLQLAHFEAFHRRLQRANRIDFRDHDARPLAAQRLRASLADLAIAADDRELAGDHDVAGPIEAVDDRVAATIDIVEFRLRHRVIDVDRREQQRPRLHHLI